MRHDFVVDHSPGIELSYLLQNWQAIWNQTILCLWHTLNGENEKNMKVSCGRHNYKGEFFQANQTDMAAMWWYAIGKDWTKKSFNDCHSRTPAAKIIPSLNQSLQNTSSGKTSISFLSPLYHQQICDKQKNPKSEKTLLWNSSNGQIDYMLIFLILYAFTLSIRFVRLSYIFFSKFEMSISAKIPNVQSFWTKFKPRFVWQSEVLKNISISYKSMSLFDNDMRLQYINLRKKSKTIQCGFNCYFIWCPCTFILWIHRLWHLTNDKKRFCATKFR